MAGNAVSPAQVHMKVVHGSCGHSPTLMTQSRLELPIANKNVSPTLAKGRSPLSFGMESRSPSLTGLRRPSLSPKVVGGGHTEAEPKRVSIGFDLPEDGGEQKALQSNEVEVDMKKRSSWRDNEVAMQPIMTGPGRVGLGPTMTGVDFVTDRNTANEEEHQHLVAAGSKFVRDRLIFRTRTVFLLLLMAGGWFLLFICRMPEVLLTWFCWSMFLLVVTTLPGLIMCFPKPSANERTNDRDDVAVLLALGGRAACLEELPVLVEGLRRTSALVPMEHIWIVMNGKQDACSQMGVLKNAIKEQVPNVNIVFVPRASKTFSYYWLARHLKIGHSRGLNNYKSVIVMDHDTSLTPDFTIPHYEAGAFVGYAPDVKGFACLLRTLPPREDAPCNHRVLGNLQDLEYMGGSLNKVWQHHTGSVICPNGAFFLCQIPEFVAACEEHDDVFHGDDFMIGYILTETLGHDIKMLTDGAAITEPPYTLKYTNGQKGLFRQRGYSWDLVNFKLAKKRLRMAFGPSGRRGFLRSIIRRLDALQELNCVMMDPFRIPLTIWCFWREPRISLIMLAGFIALKWFLSIVTYVKFKDGFPKRQFVLTFLSIPLYQVLMQVFRLYGMFVYFTNFRAYNGNVGRRTVPIKQRADLPDPQQYNTSCPATLNSQDLAAEEIDWFSGQWGETAPPESKVSDDSQDASTRLNGNGGGSLTGAMASSIFRSFQNMTSAFRRPAESRGAAASPRAMPTPRSRSFTKSASSLNEFLPSELRPAGIQQVYIEFANSIKPGVRMPPIDLCRSRPSSFTQSALLVPPPPGGLVNRSSSSLPDDPMPPFMPSMACKDPNCRFCTDFRSSEAASRIATSSNIRLHANGVGPRTTCGDESCICFDV